MPISPKHFYLAKPLTEHHQKGQHRKFNKKPHPPITITHVATNHHQRWHNKEKKESFSNTKKKKEREKEITLTNTHFNFFLSLSLPSPPLLSLSSSIPNLPKVRVRG
jgi:hypothetical protein